MTTVNRRTILVVDDSVLSRRIMKSCLAKTGVELDVVEADGGHAGLRLHAERRPDVTFLDLTMGDISGLVCLEGIRARAPHAVVVVVTADVQPRVAESALALGALQVLPKPPTPDTIRAALNRGLALVDARHDP